MILSEKILRLISLIKYLIIIYICCISIVNADQISLSQDSNGWSIFDPTDPPDSYASRIVFVDPDDPDESGTVYDSDDFSDPFNPGAIDAYQNFDTAYAQLRTGYPDWILVKRGKTVVPTAIGQNLKSGKDANEPFVWGWYGTSGAMPIIKTGSTTNWIYLTANEQYVAFVGIDFYASVRNPSDGDYNGTNTAQYVIGLYVTTGETVQGFLFEGCYFRWQSRGINFQTSTGTIKDWTVRRCTFADTYSTTEHAHAYYLTGASNFLIEENYFIHCGWLIQSTDPLRIDPSGGQATMYNHSTYTATLSNSTMQENVSIAPSSGHFKSEGYASHANHNNLYDNNLMIDGEVCISSGQNGSNLYLHYQNTWSNNVATNISLSDPTGGAVSWAIYLRRLEDCDITNNLFINFLGGNTTGLYIRNYVKDNVFSGNIFYELNSTEQVRGEETITTDVSGNAISSNHFQNSSATDYAVRSLNSYDFSSSKYVWANNKWYNEDGQSTGFQNAGSTYSLTDFKTQVGDTTSTWEQVSYTDANRDIDTYMTHISESPATIAQFVVLCRAQSIFDWDTNLMADNVNDWIRVGFDMGESGDSTPPTISSVTIDATGTQTTIVWDETVVTTGYDNGDCQMTCANAGSVDLNSVSGSGDTRTFTNSVSVYEGDTCTLACTAALGLGDDEIEDTAGNDMADVSSQAVTESTYLSYPIDSLSSSNGKAACTLSGAKVTIGQ